MPKSDLNKSINQSFVTVKNDSGIKHNHTGEKGALFDKFAEKMSIKTNVLRINEIEKLENEENAELSTN